MKLPNMDIAKQRKKKEVKHIYQENLISDIFVGKKYYLKTYGCQMNFHDSEEIRSHLENLGFVETNRFEESDLVILNTCAIRENVHDKVFGFLGRCKHLKEKKNDLLIALCGCMAQEKNVCEEILNKYTYVDLVFGTHNINDLGQMLLEHNDKLKINVLNNPEYIYENISYNRDSKITAWVNIMYGCDKFCTYCIVPYTRGSQRSRKHENIIKEVEKLVKDGYKEVTLLGQNVNAYGKDSEDEVSFAQLLSLVAQTNIPRIRFQTSHPWDFTDEIIEVIAKYDNIMPYVHLPVQSGSNRILKLMGRRYTKEDYIKLFYKIKKKIPNVAITTDIIVGFPNESDEDFQATLDLVNECKYDSAFTFIYSPREGTPAAKMKDNISKEIKEARLQELIKLVNHYSKENNEEYLDQVVPVLVLDKTEKNKDKVYGYTDTMKLVNIEADEDTIGKIINVKINTAKSFTLEGKVFN